MSTLIKRYSRFSPLPINIQILPLNKHKITLNNPFSETTCFKGYEYPLRLVLETLLPKTPILVEINILTEHTKFDQIIQFLISTLSNYTGICFDNVMITVLETNHEFSVAIDDKLIVSQKRY